MGPSTASAAVAFRRARDSAAVRIGARSSCARCPGRPQPSMLPPGWSIVCRGRATSTSRKCVSATCAMSSRERMSSSRHPRRLRTGSLRAAWPITMSGVGTSGSDSLRSTRTVRDSISPLRVGFVGSFIPTKAPHLLIEAARMLPAGSVTVDLAGEIASYHGDDSYRTRLAPLLLIRLSVVMVPFPTIGCPNISAAWTFWSCRRSGWRTRRSSSRKHSPRGCPSSRQTLEECERRCAARWTAFCSSPGTLDALAAQLRRLQSEPGLFERLRRALRPPRPSSRTPRRCEASTRD